jgi:hypothetical protein
MVGLACVALVAAPASAKVYEHVSFVDDFAFTDDNFCDSGVTLDVEGTATGSGTAVVRGDGIVYYGVRVLAEAIVSDPDTGAFVRTVTRVNETDLKIVDNGDGTMIIDVLGTGNFTAYDSDGKAIVRDPGQTRWQILIDHGGTLGDPTDDEFLEFLGVTKGSTGRSDDYCAAVLAVIG